MPKIELLYEKFDKMGRKLDNLESCVKVVDGKVDRKKGFESFSKDAALLFSVLNAGMSMQGPNLRK